MFKLTSLVLVMLILCRTVFSQTINVEGVISDTTEKKPVRNAVVALLIPKDSILYKFTRTDKEGHFSLKDLKPGVYVLMTTHPLFADYLDSINLKEPSVNLGTIALTNKSRLLEEVIVRTGSPIKIKGDTTIYTADSFKVRAGANVEELLKKLPGIQVDKNGKITAMGEKVTKVLVDGEEFFGDDPGIATKNLRADAVDKVEVYDKKSDQAVFTGIDDGQKDKTINLKLKDAAKHGYFGKVEAGSDMQHYYNNNVMVNAFKDKRKLAAYGIMSNTGKTNLDWNESQSYGGSDGMTTEITDDGGVMMMFNNSDEGDSYYNGRGGIPTNWNGGLHYSNKFNANKESLNSGYKFSKVNSPTGQRTYTKNFIGDSSYTSNNTTNGFSTKLKQAFNASFEAMIDSSNTIKLTTKATTANTKSSNDYLSESLTNNNALINKSERHSTGTLDNTGFNATGLWKHKFKKKSRTLSINTNVNLNQSKSNIFLFSQNNYFKTGVPLNSDTTDQNNIRDNTTHSYSATLVYTEPLAKDIFMSVNYTNSISNNSNDRLSYNKDGAGLYTTRIDSLSNVYQYKQSSNKPGLNFRINKKKVNVGIGSSVGYNHFEQNNISKLIDRSYDFVNLYPTASFSLKMKKNQFIRINYNGNSNAPTLDQLQPITDNTDPLNIYKGNPDLKQSFQHRVNAGYSFYNVLKERNLWSNINLSSTRNAFVTESIIDSTGKTIYRTINKNGNYNMNIYTQYGFKWKKPNMRMSFGPTMNLSQNSSVVNSQSSITKNEQYGMNVQGSKDKENKYDIGIDANGGWSKATNSINKSANASYRYLNMNLNANLTILKKYELRTDIDYQTKEKDPRFPASNTYTLWNAALKRKIYKQALEATLSVNDILNQNRGYDRSFNDYRYTETYYTTLKRYWMLSVVWNFNKNGQPVKNF